MSSDDTHPWYLRVLPHWPTTWPGAVVAVALLIFAGWLLYWMAHDPRSKVIVALFDKNGTAEVKLEHVYEFTTASYLTKYDLTADRADDPERKQQLEKLRGDTPWYYVDDPLPGSLPCGRSVNIDACLGSQVLDFKRALDSYKSAAESKRIQGYEIYESYGSGSSALKRGLTWKVTVPEGSDFDKDDLVRLYVQYWHRTNGIYIEDFSVPKTRR